MRGIEVGMKLKTTSLTSEVKTIPLSIFKVAASGASLGGVSGINRLYHNTSHFPFILQELPQLIESPRVEITPLCFPMLGGLPDTGEVFDSNCRPGVLQSFTDNRLRDTVVSIGLKPFLPTTKAFQGALSTPRPFSLKALTNSSIVMFSILNLTSTKELSSGGNCYKSLSHITANNCGSVFKLGYINYFREHNIKEDTSLTPNKGRSSYIPPISEIFYLVSTKQIRNLDSPLDSRNAYCLGFRDKPEVPTSNSTLKKDTGRLEVSQMPFSIGLHRGIGSRNLSDNRASHLSGEGKTSTNIFISKSMKSKTPGKIVILKSYLAHIIAGLGKAINRLPQGLRRINQLQGYCSGSFTFHQSLGYHIFSGKSSLGKEVCRNSTVA